MLLSLSLTSNLHELHHDDYAAAAAEIWDAVGDLSGFEIFGTQILVACYARPTVHRGIITAGMSGGSSIESEDIWQGKVGMVIKTTPASFKTPAGDPLPVGLFGGYYPEPGEWVVFAPQNTQQLSVMGDSALQLEEGRGWRSGWPCRLIFARDLIGRVAKPHMVV